MRTNTTTLLALAASATPFVSAQSSSSNCSSGLHIIVARASGEHPGEGIIGAVASMIQDRIEGSDSVAVDYPATLNNYPNSESAGVTAMNRLVMEYATSCPNSKYALLGYSQGAQVVGDVICGGSEGAGFPMTPALNSTIGKNMVAAIQMGDPSYIPGLSYDAGTSQDPGFFKRTNTAACDPFASRIKSYCDTGDFYCASGKNFTSGLRVHLSYIGTYRDQATDFVVSQYNAAANGSSPSSTTTTPTSSSRPSATSSTGSTVSSTARPNAASQQVASLLHVTAFVSMVSLGLLAM